MGTDPRQNIPAFVRKARAERAAEYEITFRMKGKFPFPLQMLTEDRCWPATRQDASEILRSIQSNPGDVVEVTLAHAGDETWTPGSTWHASGWTASAMPDEESTASASETPTT